MRSAAPAIPDIVEEHLEDLAFLSLQRRRLIIDWETNLDELAEHDERIEAHRDALRVAGDAAAHAARARLEDPASSWDTYACARILIEQSELDGDALRELLADCDDFQLDGWREAFRRAPAEHRTRLLPHAPLGEENGTVRALAVDATAWHGGGSEAECLAALEHEDPAVRAAMARSLPWASFSSRDPALVLAEKINDPDERVARMALWSLALLSPPSALSSTRQAMAAESVDPFTLRVAGMLGSADDLQGLARRAGEPAALLALGDLGDVRGLDVLTEQLDCEDGSVKLAAAQGVSLIAGFTEESSDPPAEDTLDADASRALATAARDRLDPEQRWLRGHAFPYSGPADEWTTESRWRQLVRGGDPATDRDLREVPDGFFTGLPTDEAECGI